MKNWAFFFDISTISLGTNKSFRPNGCTAKFWKNKKSLSPNIVWGCSLKNFCRKGFINASFDETCICLIPKRLDVLGKSILGSYKSWLIFDHYIFLKCALEVWTCEMILVLVSMHKMNGWLKCIICVLRCLCRWQGLRKTKLLLIIWACSRFIHSRGLIDFFFFFKYM